MLCMNGDILYKAVCLFERAIQNRRRFAGRNGKWEIRRGWDTFLRENSLLQMTPHSILSHFPSCWIWRLKVNVLTCLGLGFCRGESVDAEKFRLISHVPQIHPPLLPNFLYQHICLCSMFTFLFSFNTGFKAAVKHQNYRQSTIITQNTSEFLLLTTEKLETTILDQQKIPEMTNYNKESW